VRELLGVDLDAIHEAAAHLEPYLRVDGTRVWSLMQLERQLRPNACGRVRGGYVARRRPTGHRNPAPVTDKAGHCSFCGAATGPFTKVEGLFTVLMWTDCQAARGYGAGPYPVMTRAQMRESLALLPSWALEQKAAANRQVIAVMRERLAAGEAVARMIRSRGWPGWSVRPRPPRTCSPNGKQPTTPTDVHARRQRGRPR
jgi:hypothetical protein